MTPAPCPRWAGGVVAVWLAEQASSGDQRRRRVLGPAVIWGCQSASRLLGVTEPFKLACNSWADIVR